MGPGNVIITCILCNIAFADNANQHSTLVRTCGIDNSPIKVVYEGVGVVQTYPWLGTLFYPMGDKHFATTVVLITKQVVIGSAIDIDKVPKTDFRSRSRVVLGTTCRGPSIRIRDYSYHPAYNKTTYSALVLVLLETEYLIKELRPICSPPNAWNNPQVYVMKLSDDCTKSKLDIHKMEHVSLEKCHAFYRRTGLNAASMWPIDPVCARALHGEECVWRNGAVLMMRHNNVWSLLGFGIAGPGCRAPARFVDYTIGSQWASHSIARIGQPAVTKIAPDHIVLRRKTRGLQRFGLCDSEEQKEELFTDITTITLQPKIEPRRVRYNFTIMAKMDYSCIVFKVNNSNQYWDPPVKRPAISLRRWCSSPKLICATSRYTQVDFYIDIIFSADITYKVAAYGEEMRVLDMKKTVLNTNEKRPYPEIPFFHWYNNTS